MLNKSDSRHLYKDTTTVATVDVVFKDGTNIQNPSLLLTADVDYSANCNYLYIPQFDRFYFILNFDSIREGLWNINCHVDVLSSNRVEILNQEAVIARQEYRYNLDLDDGTLKSLSKPTVIFRNFPKSINDYAGDELGTNILIIGGSD